MQKIQIAIVLDGNKESIFYPGQNVTGNVRVETKDEIKIRGILLAVYGDAKVCFSSGTGDDKRTYTGHENFIELETYLTGSDSKDSEIILTPGVHTFPMSFVLPDTVPSSFEGSLGSVKYVVQAIVDSQKKIVDSTEILITVVRHLNLNHEPPQLREPVVVQEEKPMVGCCYHCCCIKGLPDIELRINRGCFVPGETIILNGHVVNKSNTKIKLTTINFMQEVQFCATHYDGEIHSRNHQYKTLGSIRRPKIEIGCTDTWSDVSFTIPPVPTSRLDGCNIINISYLIQVKAEFGRGCAESGIRQDIIIGDIPLQGNSLFGGPITAQPSPFQSEFTERSNYSGYHGAGWNQDNSAASVGHK